MKKSPIDRQESWFKSDVIDKLYSSLLMGHVGTDLQTGLFGASTYLPPYYLN